MHSESHFSLTSPSSTNSYKEKRIKIVSLIVKYLALLFATGFLVIIGQIDINRPNLSDHSSPIYLPMSEETIGNDLNSDSLELPADLKEIALRDLGETPELRTKKMLELKRRISRLPGEDRIQDTTDINLIRFLRGRKYDVDLALQTTVNLVHFNRAHPEWTENHTAKEFVDFASFFQVLKATDKGRVIVIFRPSVGIKILTPEFIAEHPLAIIRSMLWFMNKMSFNVYAQVCGGLLLESFEGFTAWDTLTIARACPINQQIAAMLYLQNCIGFRFSGAYLFHEPKFITWLFYLAKGFINERVRSRFHLCGSDLAQVHQEVDDVAILPEYFGGTVKDGDYDFVGEQVQLEAHKEERKRQCGEEVEERYVFRK